MSPSVHRSALSVGGVTNRTRSASAGQLRVSRMWSASDHALATLIDCLRMNTFAIGERLPNLRELSGAMGLSHVVVRQALDVLEAERIVDIRLGRGGGIYVTGATGFPRCLSRIYDDESASMAELIAARAVLEREVVLRAIHAAGAAELEELDALVDQMEQAISEAEVFVELSVRFFLRLSVLAGNPVLTECMGNVLNRLAVVGVRTSISVLTAEELSTGHKLYAELIAGIRAGSSDRVRSATERHIELLTDVDSRTPAPSVERGRHHPTHGG